MRVADSCLPIFDVLYSILYSIRMLFHKKTQKAAKVAWMIIGVLVIVSMVIFYAPIF